MMPAWPVRTRSDKGEHLKSFSEAAIMKIKQARQKEDIARQGFYLHGF